MCPPSSTTCQQSVGTLPERTALAGLTALHLRDDKPGHFRCAEGVLAAAQCLRPLHIHTVEIARLAVMAPRLLSWLTNANTSPHLVLKRMYGLDPASIPPCDVIVSAGGDTLAANIALARLRGVPNIFYGSLRRYRPGDFSLVLNSYESASKAPNELLILKPSPADPGLLPVPAMQANGLPELMGLLIGGNAGTVSYSPDDWDHLLALIDDSHRQYGVRWIVSNSRRTPDGTSDRLQGLIESRAPAIESLIDVRKSGHGTLEALFQRSCAIVVTADSSAMLSEAIWMQRPVMSVQPQKISLPEKERAYRRFLEDNRWCRTANLSALTADLLMTSLATVVPLRQNPQRQLADLLQRHLPAIFPAAETAR